MPEYIEREKVHRLVRSLKRYGWNNPDKSKYRTTVDIDDVQFGIDKIPAADVVEVRHGKWKLKQYEGGILDGEIYDECSICEYQRFFDDIRFKTAFNYCPNCGAKMDGKEYTNE